MNQNAKSIESIARIMLDAELRALSVKPVCVDLKPQHKALKMFLALVLAVLVVYASVNHVSAHGERYYNPTENFVEYVISTNQSGLLQINNVIYFDADSTPYVKQGDCLLTVDGLYFKHTPEYRITVLYWQCGEYGIVFAYDQDNVLVEF